MTGIPYPVTLESYPKFEDQNEISINVLYTSGKVDEIQTIYITKQQKEKHVDLLLYKDHYVWIKNMSALLNHRKGHDHKRYHVYSGLILLNVFNNILIINVIPNVA